MQGVLAQPRAGGLPPGTRFGRYATLVRLARGGMAELYLAKHIDRPQLEKLWVIKRVLPHLAESSEFVGMFQNEARLASTLDHPNIAQVVDYGVSGEEHYLVMEYVHGKDARAILREATARGGFPIECAITIVMRVAEALQYAHERRDDAGDPLEIVHRDVSPSNVIVGYDGLVRLADFGIAKAVARTRVTRTGTVKGKAGYMSPEQCRSEPVDRRSDVFGLGVLLYELSTLRRVFFAASDLAIMSKVVAGEFKSPREVVDGYPEDLQRIVMRSLALDPDGRYPTAQAFRDALEEFAQQQGLELSAPEVGTAIQRLFGNPPYPTIDLDDDAWLDDAPTAIASGGSALALQPVLEPARRGSRWPFVAAAALGLGGFLLGISLAGSSDEPEPTTVPLPAAVEPAVSAPAQDRPADQESEPEEPEELIIVEDPDPPPGSDKRRAPRRKKPKAERPAASKKRKTFGPPQWGK